MKKYSIWFSVLLFFLLGCTPDDVAPLGERVDRTEQLQGTWTITQARLVDSNAEFRGFPEFATVQDITNILEGRPHTDFVITFSGSDVTIVKGNSPVTALPEGSGTWRFISTDAAEDIQAAQTIGIVAPTAIEVDIDGEIGELGILSFVELSSNPARMALKLERKDGETAFLRYEYLFEKQ